MRHTRTFQIELGERKANGARTFGAVISTEAPVPRRDWERGEFTEVLSHAKGAVDLSRAPLPLLESHDSRSLPIGIVDNLRLVDGKLRGDVTFGTSARAQEIAADVEAGIIRNLSAGYSIEKVVEKLDGKQKTITATRWTPHEVSAVAIGADAGAGFGRSHDMRDKTSTATTPTTTAPAPTETRDAAAIERERCSDILRLARRVGEQDEFADQMISSGTPIAEARRLIVERSVVRDSTPIDGHHSSGLESGGYVAVRGHRDLPTPWMERRAAPTLDAGRDFRGAAVDAILLRAGVPLSKPHAAARDVPGSVLDLARICVSRTGNTFRGGNEELIRRALTTGDFPEILAGVMHKAVLNGYETEPSSHRAWVRPQQVPDFRDQHRVILGSAPELKQVGEAGEYTNGGFDEGSTSYRIAKYGRIVQLTWEVLINDTLGMFLRVQPALGQAARRLEADTVYALLALNAGAGPTMQDGNPLFHIASHANLGSAATFDAAALGAARSLLRKQTALGGGHLSLVPRFLIVPVEREHTAEVLLAQAARSVTTVDSATPQWISSLELVVEPRLADGAFYLAADSGQIDTCELGLLEENFAGPTITEDRGEDFRRDVIGWKVRHVIGAKFLDWRGIVKQPLS